MRLTDSEGDVMDKVLRIGVLNNFNHTDAEIDQAIKLMDKWLVFVNSNAKTPIRFGPCVVTVNPGLDAFIEPVGLIDFISAVRVKVVAGAKPGVTMAMEDSYIWARQNNIPVLLTAMRFPSVELMNKFTNKPELYEWKNSYYRLIDWGSIDVPEGSFYCDKDHLGCPSCMNCSKLTYGDDKLEIYGMNLSSSGSCSFNCPGCFAKKCLQMTRNKLPLFDKAFKNSKQRGKDV